MSALRNGLSALLAGAGLVAALKWGVWDMFLTGIAEFVSLLPEGSGMALLRLLFGLPVAGLVLTASLAAALALADPPKGKGEGKGDD